MNIHEITVITRNPSGAPGDMGSCEVGHHRIMDDILMLVDAGGVPLRSANGEQIMARLAAGDIARTTASRLTLVYWRTQRATDELVEGFSRPIRYARNGWV